MNKVRALALILGAALAIAAMPTRADKVADLNAFADAFDAAQIAQDRAALEAMVADDLVFLDGDGRRLGKADFIAGWTGAGDDYDPVTLADRVVTMLGSDAGLASAEAVLSGRSAGKPFAVRIRFTDIFRRRGATWQAVHIQVTRMPPPAPKE